MLTLFAKLLSTGMQNGIDKSKRQVKYSANLKGSLPAVVKVFTEPAYISESIALAALINEADCIKGDVVVFDRGLQTRNAFDKFTFDSKLFIGRSKTAVKHKVVSINEVSAKPKYATLTISSDVACYLFGEAHKQTDSTYRMIKGVIDKSGEETCLITNIMDEDAYLIAQWYKQRWEIEVFFKFIKQHLNASHHLVSRTEKGLLFISNSYDKFIDSIRLSDNFELVYVPDLFLPLKSDLLTEKNDVIKANGLCLFNL